MSTRKAKHSAKTAEWYTPEFFDVFGDLGAGVKHSDHGLTSMVRSCSNGL